MEKLKTLEIKKEQTWKFGKNRISIDTNNDELFITISRSTFLANIPVCTIVEKLKENSELSISDISSAFILTYYNEQKSLTIKDDKVYLLNMADDSAVSIEIV
ncbi:hypothetical protein [Dysgonomonas mossii]|uniref:hypothetical protein n=1 Tax=Dysgonomonas mossii TaxID=163665 RepID=UPI003993D185